MTNHAVRTRIKSLTGTRSRLVLPTALAIAGMLAGDLALAQDDLLLEEIVVTARKRTENLQEVPLSITAISGVELERASVYALDDLAEMTPGLTYQNIGAFNTPTIRGLAQTSQGGLQGNVGVFIDGVFLNNRSSLEFGVLDLERIEVVKGPQGALYGRNTFAGAINYVTRSPSTDDINGRLSAEIGSAGRWEVGGSVNLPLGENAAVRVFAATSEFDGTITNARDGGKLGGYNERSSYGLSAIFDPSEQLSIKLFAARTEIDEDQPPLILVPVARNDCGATYNLPDGRVFNSLYCSGLQAGDAPNLNGLGNGQAGDFTIAYLNVEYDLGFATLTANFSHSESEYSTLFDNVSNPVAETLPLGPLGFSAQFFTNSSGDVAEQQSYEVRLASNDDGPLGWLIGGSVFDTLTGSVLSSISTLLDNPSEIGRISFVPNRLDIDVNAAFGSVSYALNDRNKVSAEIRYTEEDQFLERTVMIFFIPNFPTSITSAASEFSYTTPRVTFEHAWNDDTLLYASAARGVKSGGTNGAAFADTPYADYLEESNWTFEVGIKTSILDGRGVFNAVAYTVDWTDLQIPAPPDLQIGTAIVNAAGATSTGIEIDTTINLTDNLTVRGAATWLNPEFDSGTVDAAISPLCGERAVIPPTVACSTEVGGQQLPRTSDFQLYLGATYTWPNLIGDFDGYIRVDTSHQAGKYSLSLNQQDQGDINLTNLRIGLESERYEIALWAENVFDEEYNDRVTVTTDPAAGFACAGCGITVARFYPGNTQTYGLRATWRF